MQTHVNTFKPALREGRMQIGQWVGPADPHAIEAMAGADVDWRLIDGCIDTGHLCMGGR